MGEYKSRILSDEEMKLSLDDRRKARQEKLVQYLSTHPGAAEEFKGFIAQYSKEDGSRLTPWNESNTKPGTTMTPRADATQVAVDFGDIPAIRRTTLEEKVAAMVERLQACPPALQEELLKRVASEYWKAGMPVTGEALKQVAAHYLNRGNRQNRRTK